MSSDLVATGHVKVSAHLALANHKHYNMSTLINDIHTIKTSVGRWTNTADFNLKLSRDNVKGL